MFQIKVRQGHGRRGGGDRSDTSKGKDDSGLSLNKLWGVAKSMTFLQDVNIVWSRRPLPCLTLTRTERSVWRNWLRSWADTIFTPQGTLPIFNSNSQNVNTKWWRGEAKWMDGSYILKTEVLELEVRTPPIVLNFPPIFKLITQNPFSLQLDGHQCFFLWFECWE